MKKAKVREAGFLQLKYIWFKKMLSKASTTAQLIWDNTGEKQPRNETNLLILSTSNFSYLKERNQVFIPSFLEVLPLQNIRFFFLIQRIPLN